MIGLDVGSTTAKMVKIVDGDIKYQITGTHNWKDLVKGMDKKDIISTGYFRHSVPHKASVTEITAAQFGVKHYFPDAEVIVDIGGQDTKVIDVKRNNFIINDKCSAGTGAFLEFVANYFKIELNEMGSLHGRAKRIPEFIRTLRGAREFPNERGYVLFQEFVPNDGYDLKIVVIGDKLSYIVRSIRKGDFRASGGGDLFFDKNYVTKNIIDTAFATSDALNFKCMGYDYVVNNKTGEAKIVEISYGFSHTALLQAGGYFDRNGNWHDDPLNAPKELLKNLLDTSKNA